jgi:UPF0716 protein FxsA
MFFKLFLLFTIIPILELYLLIKIGGKIGAGNTVLIILATATVGAYFTKSQGFMVIRRIQKAFDEGQLPGHELLHGLFVLLGGFTLLTPGFITDFIGLSMLLPGFREIYVGLAERLIRNRIETGKWKMTDY